MFHSLPNHIFPFATKLGCEHIDDEPIDSTCDESCPEYCPSCVSIHHIACGKCEWYKDSETEPTNTRRELESKNRMCSISSSETNDQANKKTISDNGPHKCCSPDSRSWTRSQRRTDDTRYDTERQSDEKSLLERSKSHRKKVRKRDNYIRS